MNLSGASATAGNAACAELRAHRSALVVVLFALALAWVAAPASAKGIYATVQAPWTETSLLQEGCEWAARGFGAPGFYRCLEALRTAPNAGSDGGGGGASARASSPATQFAALRSAVVDAWAASTERLMMVSPGQRNLFGVEMAARVYSPAVEAHYTLAESAATVDASFCSSNSSGSHGNPFALVVATEAEATSRSEAILVTDAAALAAALTASPVPRHPARKDIETESAFAEIVPGLDHVHPLSAAAERAADQKAATSTIVTIYGLVGEAATMVLYDAAVAHVAMEARKKPMERKRVTLIFRHLPVDPTRVCRAMQANAESRIYTTTTFHGSAAGSGGASWVSRPLYVQGYAATVDLKSMEYKVVDEKKRSTHSDGADTEKDATGAGSGSLSTTPTAAAATTGSGEPSDGIGASCSEVGGFLVSTLKERHRALSVQLDAFASAMEDALGGEETKVDLDAIETQNIGVAAAQYICESPAEERLAVLADVVARFPMYAARLGRLAAQSARLADLQARIMQRPYRSLPTTNAAMFVNGVELLAKELSLFDALSRLRAEEALLDLARQTLTAVPPSREGSHTFVPVDENSAAARALVPAVRLTQRLLRQHATHHPYAPPRVAFPLSAVTWLNNIETAPGLAGLSRALSTAFQVMPNGVRLLPRRNLVHVMTVVDAQEPGTWQMLATFLRIISQGVFARFGVAFVNEGYSETVNAGTTMQMPGRDGAASPPPSPAKLSKLSLEVAAVFYRASQLGKVGSIAALCADLAFHLQQAPLTTELLRSAAVDVGVIEDSVDLLDLVSDPDFQAFQAAQQAALRRLGAVPARGSGPSIFVNGARVPAGDAIRNTFDCIQAESESVRRLIARKVLTDSMDDMYAAILDAEGASDHYQSGLEERSMGVFSYRTPALLDFLHLQSFLYPVAEPVATSWAAVDAAPSTMIATGKKAPLVATFTPVTSVLVLPNSLRVGDAAMVLRSALRAHAQPPFTGQELAAREALVQKRIASRKTAPTPYLEGAGAARLSIVFPDPQTATAATTRSVQQTVNILLDQDAVSERRTGRQSQLLAQYVAWLGEAISKTGGNERDADAAIANARLDDPSVETALREVLAMPDDIETALRAAAAAPVDAEKAICDKLSSVRAAFRQAVREQLPKALMKSGPSAQVALAVPLLLVNSRTVLLEEPATFTAADVRFLLRAAARPASIVLQRVAKLNFMQLGPEGDESGFRADDLDAEFFAAKSVALESVLASHRAQRRGAEIAALLGERAPLNEDEVLPPVSTVGDLAFTIEPAAAGDGGHGAGAGSSGSGSAAGSTHHITIVVDPVAREAQLVVALAEFMLRSPLSVSVTVYLNPSLEVKRPIRDLYTLVASPALSFDASTGYVVAPAAVFRALPTQALLTLGIEEPHAWTVFAHEAETDLDNIILARLPRHQQFVSATYRIQSLIVAGSALRILPERGHMTPATGLPLQLRPVSAGMTQTIATARTDTLVMETLGYYQLQGSAGLQHLTVQPGPFAAAYYISGFHDDPDCLVADVVTVEGTVRPGLNTSSGQRVPVLLSTFAGLSLELFVREVPSSTGAGRQPGILRIAEELASADKHVWPPHPSRRGDRAFTDRPVKPTLNIFSVASGHLYERFLRMMMYSVHKASSDKDGAHTTRIKFWVIENFLSPQFKRYIPLLAEHLGFEVGFVTYRWPWWLQRQTEKQRRIWAYKILFLDVIFPLDVDRVIFVDADQTARADLHELYRMDIHGSPIAMTPFCEANRNEATTGFRFWQQGFWTRHLRGKPYHISAIFVVDLHRFRAMGAGNIYRATYAGLVRDPNSLSNLDQDLPNYVQHEVPIFSLPEEWLWCETWCSQESKARAKTIDLCNNPLTKMPKLDNAKMIVPGWEDVDDFLEGLAVSLLSAQANATRAYG